MAAKEIEVSTQPNIKVNLENHEATHYTCTEEKKKQQIGHWSTAATPRPFLVVYENSSSHAGEAAQQTRTFCALCAPYIFNNQI